MRIASRQRKGGMKLKTLKTTHVNVKKAVSKKPQVYHRDRRAITCIRGSSEVFYKIPCLWVKVCGSKDCMLFT